MLGAVAAWPVKAHVAGTRCHFGMQDQSNSPRGGAPYGPRVSAVPFLLGDTAVFGDFLIAANAAACSDWPRGACLPALLSGPLRVSSLPLRADDEAPAKSLFKRCSLPKYLERRHDVPLSAASVSASSTGAPSRLPPRADEAVLYRGRRRGFPPRAEPEA